jgi:hypothetical protein
MNNKTAVMTADFEELVRLAAIATDKRKVLDRLKDKYNMIMTTYGQATLNSFDAANEKPLADRKADAFVEFMQAEKNMVNQAYKCGMTMDDVYMSGESDKPMIDSDTAVVAWVRKQGYSVPAHLLEN